MPKAILQFNLPEEKDEFDLANKAGDMSLALYDMAEYLRERIKYGNLPAPEEEIYEKVKEKFYEILNDNKVDLL